MCSTRACLCVTGPGWRAEIRPSDHPVADFDFDVVVGADGRRNTLEGTLALACTGILVQVKIRKRNRHYTKRTHGSSHAYVVTK